MTALLYLAGASEARAGFILLYPLAILAASTLVRPRPAIALAVTAVGAFLFLYVAIGAGIISSYGPTGARFLGTGYIVYSALILAVSCVGVAWIGGYLVENLRTTDARLVQAAEKVSSLQELNQAIVVSIHSGLLTVGGDGRILFVNERGSTILGADASQLRGQSLAVALGSRLLAPAALEARLSQKTTQRFEVSFEPANRPHLLIGLTVLPLAAGDSALGRYLVTFQDLTDVKKLEEEARLNEKLAAMGEMAAQLAHEIRNPLGAISGSAQVLLGEPGVSEEQAELLTIIRRESRRLSDALNQFLQGTRPVASTLGLVDIEPVVEETVTLLRNSPELHANHSIALVGDAGPHICHADPDRIKQVVWNLARNGIEAMPGGGRLEIRLGVSRG